MTYQEYDDKYKAGLLKKPPVTYRYTRTPTQISYSKSMNSYGSITDGVRYIHVLSNESDHLLIFIPLALKLGSHDWSQSNTKGISVEFEPSDAYPGHTKPWSGEWGNITIKDDNPRDFKGTFSVYKNGDKSPPFLDEGEFWIKFEGYS